MKRLAVCAFALALLGAFGAPTAGAAGNPMKLIAALNPWTNGQAPVLIRMCRGQSAERRVPGTRRGCGASSFGRLFRFRLAVGIHRGLMF